MQAQGWAGAGTSRQSAEATLGLFASGGAGCACAWAHSHTGPSRPSTLVSDSTPTAFWHSEMASLYLRQVRGRQTLGIWGPRSAGHRAMSTLPEALHVPGRACVGSQGCRGTAPGLCARPALATCSPQLRVHGAVLQGCVGWGQQVRREHALAQVLQQVGQGEVGGRKVTLVLEVEGLSLRAQTACRE